MSMKFKSWVLDLQEGAVDHVESVVDRLHDKIIPDKENLRSIRLNQEIGLENEFIYKQIKKLNAEICNEIEFEVGREAMCGSMDGSDQADYLERLIREVESDPDYVDPFKDNPEPENQMYEYVASELKKIDFRELRLKIRRAKRQYDRYEKRRYEHGYI